MSVCGLLVIDHAYGISPDSLLDDETWASLQSWVVCTTSADTKQLIEAQGKSQIVSVIAEPDRNARYRAGLLAAGKLAPNVLLFHPGTSCINLKLPSLSDDIDSVRLQYIGRNNQFRWRRTLVRSDLDWYYEAASAQWEVQPQDGVVRDVTDKYSIFREDPQIQHTAIEWSRQLQAQCAMLRKDPESQDLHYEIGLSYLRTQQTNIAYDWFQSLAENGENKAVYRSVAGTLMACLNKPKMSAEKQIELYRIALSVWPNLADTYFHLAEQLLQQNQAEAALKIASTWHEGLTEHYSALDCTMVRTRLPRLVAQCHAELGNYEQAIACYNKALHINDKYYCATTMDDSQAIMHKRRDELYQQAFPLPEIKRRQPVKKFQQQNHFKIIVAFWNAADFLGGCVASIAQQDYSNYEVIFVDDVSTDGGLQEIDLSGLAEHHIVTQKKRQGPLKNQLEAVLNHCHEDDIVVILDGDDSFADSGVLSYLDQVYSALDCWVTIGQFKVNDDWRWGYARPILPDEDIGEIFTRQTLRFPVHLRTHRAGLFHRLQERDPKLNALRDKQQNFFFYASDVAYCRVIMSLAGAENIRYIARILMDYNVKNPLSVHQIKRDLQSKSCREIANLKPIAKLQTYKSCV